MLPKRNEYLDIVKGIAMILVFLGHAIQQADTINCYDNMIFDIIYSFHMPLFMLVSGYLFWSSYLKNKNGIGSLVLKRTRSLLLPLITFSVLLVPKTLLSSYMGGHDITVKLIIGSFWNSFSGNFLWFLWAVLFSVCLSSLALKISQKFSLLLCLAFFMLALLVPDTFIYPMYKYLFLFFITGLYFHKYNLIQKLNKKCHVYGGLIIGIAYIIIMQRFSRAYFEYDMNITNLLSHMNISVFCIRYVLAYLGCGLALMIIWYGRSKLSIFANVGRKSLGLYTFQCFILTWLNNRLAFIDDIYLSSLCIFVFVYSLTIFVLKLSEKNKFTRILFLGYFN